MRTSKIFFIIFLVLLTLILAQMIISSYPSPQPSPQPKPSPSPSPRPVIGGCAGTRYGCCPDGQTSKINTDGSNCR